jgi:hypothetical protein
MIMNQYGRGRARVERILVTNDKILSFSDDNGRTAISYETRDTPEALWRHTSCGTLM